MAMRLSTATAALALLVCAVPASALMCYDTTNSPSSVGTTFVTTDSVTGNLVPAMGQYCYWEQVIEGQYTGYIDKGDESRFSYACSNEAAAGSANGYCYVVMDENDILGTFKSKVCCCQTDGCNRNAGYW
eukprot:CAMPEP_0197846852 /NCGR_PEP_ID=MMETSP1438-20131217/4641_1 /TAXON_ID=1461541 /ORGANISM="Pterosperma sp., Strain CCMP1384" /LENGTH=129 /DNA_ID=CAMNT_0043458627 /DNA_START=126 /DNA_END=512 /DNA_ORIENTATION=+